MTLSLVVPGSPVGKGRARTFYHRQARRIVSMTPHKTAAFEGYIRALFAQKYPDHVPLEGPVEMDVLIYFPIPKSASKAKARDMRWQRILPTKRPDCTNVLKAVEDALNGLAYRDDAQIVMETVIKQYDDQPRIEVKVRPFGEEP